jgi:hypothetical protein
VKRNHLLSMGIIALSLLCGAVRAEMITFGGSPTDLGTGVIDLNDLQPSPHDNSVAERTFTWTNPGGGGFDIRITADTYNRIDTPGDVLTNNSGSARMEFFRTGTTQPVPVTGLRFSVLDLDGGSGDLRDFQFSNAVDADQPIDLRTVAVFGTDLSPVDLDGDSIFDDVISSGTGDYDTPEIAFTLDMGTEPVSSLQWTLNEYIYFGGAGGGTTTADINIVPEPHLLALALLAMGILPMRRPDRTSGPDRGK